MTYLEDLAKNIRNAVADPTAIPEDAKELFLLYALLARAKGSAVTAADVHDAWAVWMTRQDPGHEALVPFEELDAATRAEDNQFVEAIKGVVASRNPQPPREHE